MKKLLTLLFGSVLVFSLAMPVLATQGDDTKTQTAADKKAAKKAANAEKAEKKKPGKKGGKK